jgi:hypothetical protein
MNDPKPIQRPHPPILVESWGSDVECWNAFKILLFEQLWDI